MKTEYNMSTLQKDGRIFSVFSSSLSKTVNSTFVISNTQAIDTATYVCMATNRHGSLKSSTSTVSVYSKFISP